MIATDRNGKLWFVAEGTLEPIVHDADPDALTMAEEDFLFAQLPAPEKPDLGEDAFGFLYDQARDRDRSGEFCGKYSQPRWFRSPGFDSRVGYYSRP